MVNLFNKKRRSGLDRRTGEDRRQVMSLDYFDNGGKERRAYTDRRKTSEMRKGWVRTTEWSSVYTGK